MMPLHDVIPLCIIVAVIAGMAGMVGGAVLTGEWYYWRDERHLKAAAKLRLHKPDDAA